MADGCARRARTHTRYFKVEENVTAVLEGWHLLIVRGILSDVFMSAGTFSTMTVQK